MDNVVLGAALKVGWRMMCAEGHARTHAAAGARGHIATSPPAMLPLHTSTDILHCCCCAHVALFSPLQPTPSIHPPAAHRTSTWESRRSEGSWAQTGTPWTPPDLNLRQPGLLASRALRRGARACVDPPSSLLLVGPSSSLRLSVKYSAECIQAWGENRWHGSLVRGCRRWSRGGRLRMLLQWFVAAALH